jgi:peptide/nickel transport system substrate-binding protein
MKMKSLRRRPLRVLVFAAVATAALLIAGCTSASPVGSSTATSSPGKAQSGGTVTFALPPGNSPNMIFPFFSSQYVGNANLNDFMFLMYRPLYWEDGTTFQLNESKSLALPPVYNAARTQVTITMKHWKWSNGEPVSPADVSFFMGMLDKEIANWWGFVPGEFPQNVSHVTYDNAANSFTLYLTHPVNTTWFTNNQLTLIQPLPQAWNVTGPGKTATCSDQSKADVASCAAVYTYLEKLATNTSTYASNPLWQVVDGPFHLKSFAPGGSTAVLVPNPKYSGAAAHISAFEIESFTSDAAEYNVLRSGNSLTVGYIPFQDAPVKSSGSSAPNPVSGYSLQPWFNWANNYINFNYQNPTMVSLFNQLYFREAMQRLVDEQSWINNAFNGYAYPLYGPVPTYPANSYATAYEKSDPYSFSVAAARQLLTSHGWTIPSSGAATCTKPGTAADECGAGVKQGQSLSLSLVYSSGVQSLSTEMQDYQSTAAQAGITLSLKTLPINSIFAMDGPCTPSGGPTCTWQMLYFGGPVSMQPFWYPENGLGFICGSFANTGGYCNKQLDALYTPVYQDEGLSPLFTVENFEVQNAPSLNVPVQDAQLTEVADNLGGYTQSGTMAIEPEDWYFTSGS